MKKIAGNYVTQHGEPTQLELGTDGRFSLLGTVPADIADAGIKGSGQKYFLTGKWMLHGKRIDMQADTLQQGGKLYRDSITRFTTISSFSFFNRFGQPVSIRYLSLPHAGIKPHYGNSLYYFGQDFEPTDTILFRFDGYPTLTYPGDIPYAIMNNGHRITLLEKTFEGNPASRSFTSTIFGRLKQPGLTLKRKK